MLHLMAGAGGVRIMERKIELYRTMGLSFINNLQYVKSWVANLLIFLKKTWLCESLLRYCNANDMVILMLVKESEKMMKLCQNYLFLSQNISEG